MGSVKELRVLSDPGESSLGSGVFRFSDDYSVFDWGKMPDEIEGKGMSLCMMGAYNFELLEQKGVNTHYRGLRIDDDNRALDSLDEPVREMEIGLTQVPNLGFGEDGYDYEEYLEEGGNNYLIPLEIVFRNSVPIGSSIRDRITPFELGVEYDVWPDETVDLKEPFIEFSTKLEEKDRYLEEQKAREISGLGDDLDELREIAHQVNEVITERCREIGIRHMDGKIECIYLDGEIVVGDVVGTLDENRFIYSDMQLSKEFLRQFYKTYDPQWVDGIEQAKTIAEKEGLADWKQKCDVDPKPLPENIRSLSSNIYKSAANHYMARDWFDAPGIDEVVDSMSTQINR